METFDINFDNMAGKPLKHIYVPADNASVTFVFQDGMRRSFGVACSGDRSKASIRRLVLPEKVDGAILPLDAKGKLAAISECRATEPGVKDWNSVRFYTDAYNTDLISIESAKKGVITEGIIHIEYDCEDSLNGHLVELPE